MIPTKYPKVFLFFRMLLFLTEALISILHILHLPIDSSNSVEATLEKRLSRAKQKADNRSFLWKKKKKSVLFSCFLPTGTLNRPPQHTPLAKPVASPGLAASLWSISTHQARLPAMLIQSPLPVRLPGSEAHLPARYSNEGSTVNGKTGRSTGDSRNHNQKYITAVKISLSCHHPQHFTDITCPSGEAVWSQGPVTAFSSKVCKSHCRALGKSLTSLHFSLQQLLRKRNGERGMPLFQFAKVWKGNHSTSHYQTIWHVGWKDVMEVTTFDFWEIACCSRATLKHICRLALPPCVCCKTYLLNSSSDLYISS